MSQASPPAQAAVPPTKPLFPPEERFWQRYSPEHEAPISTVSSVVLHILMFTLLVALSLGLLNFTRNTEPIGVTVVEVDPDFDTPSSDSGAPPGGGGPVAVEKRDDRIKFEELEELPKAPAVRVSAAELPSICAMTRRCSKPSPPTPKRSSGWKGWINRCASNCSPGSQGTRPARPRRGQGPGQRGQRHGGQHENWHPRHALDHEVQHLRWL
jgi:hypothetical protein